MDVFTLALLQVLVLLQASRTGLRMAVLARGEAEGQNSKHQANTTALGPVTGPI